MVTKEEWAAYWQEFEKRIEPAVSTKLSRQRKWQLAKTAAGICATCGTRPLETANRCAECSRKRKNKYIPQGKTRYKNRSELKKQLIALEFGQYLFVPDEGDCLEYLRARVHGVVHKHSLGHFATKILKDGVRVWRVP